MAHKRKPPDFRDIIKSERERQGLTLTELAERAGTHQPNLSDYLSGKADIRTDTLMRLFTVLELEVRASK